MRTGDVLEVGLLSWDGKKGPWGRGSYQTVMLGVIRSIGQRQALAQGSLTQVAVLSGSHLAGFLLGDAVNYYLAYGSLYGLFKGIAMTGLKGVTRLDQGLAHYLSQVAFEVAQIARPYGGIRDLLGYTLHTVEGRGCLISCSPTMKGRYGASSRPTPSAPCTSFTPPSSPKTAWGSSRV
ncbi:hypothetical protein [Thermus antranikianii]|uniref:hypothetical protein n=1 Tax=Thermus antranikianii TaxID=88190 RepID=UPI001C7730F0|nr:hypothetical protein [Thermus antranikianii]QWK20790.1 MAG: hypothetical protein KNN15_06855 [Thermus antranikianii]